MTSSTQHLRWRCTNVNLFEVQLATGQPYTVAITLGAVLATAYTAVSRRTANKETADEAKDAAAIDAQERRTLRRVLLFALRVLLAVCVPLYVIQGLKQFLG